MKIEIDVEQFARDMKAALSAEIDSHLTQDLNRNRKNGYATKTMKSEHGEFQLDVPRDR